MEKRYYARLAEEVFRGKLSNGLDIIVVPRPGFTRKLAYFATDFGAVHNIFTLDGKRIEAPAGVAHYLEHKMFDMPGGRDVTAEFAALGAVPNAFTSFDMTAYYFTCTENFEDCLRLLLEYVSTPYFTDESVAKEQGIIGQEIGMDADNPESRVFRNLMNAMYAGHPIRTDVLGTVETIAEITPQVLYDCHRAFYDPGNMLLCVVGDVDAQAVEAMARQLLGENPGPDVRRCREWPESMICPNSYVEEAMEVAMPMFQLGFKSEPLGKGEESVRREIIGDLAAEALFGEASALYLKLYEDGLIDSSFGGGFETVDGMAMLTVSGDSDDPAAVRDAILEQGRFLAAETVPEAEFLRMKRSALGRRIRDLDSFSSTCFRLCAYHFSDFDYFDFPAVYESVTAEDVRQFIARTVTEPRCALSVISPID